MTSTTSTTQDIPSTLASMSAASLFVGELLPHVNEVILYKKFAPMGTVTSVKLCRDWVTGNSLCYAYVNFENPAEAEKAYRTLNYELLEGQPMRIMKSTRNPWVPKGGDCSCFHHHHCCAGVGVGVGMGVGANKGLVDAKTLMEAIESYSMAFKTLASQDSGESKSPTGYKYSKEFLKRMNTNNSHFTNVFIRNFKDLLDDFKLWKLCKQFGEVISAKVMVDEYGISKGFGFACFTDSDAAQRAVNKLNGLVLDGRILYAGPAMTRTQRQRDFRHYDNDSHRYEWRSPHSSASSSSGGPSSGGNSVFFGNGNMSLASCSPRICVRNLRDLVDDIRLRKEFERFGPVLHAELLKNFDGTSKGVGYVIYKDQSDASKALNSMHGKVIYGTRISVNYAPYTNTTATNTIPDDTCMASSEDISNSNNVNGPEAMATDDAGSSANNSIIPSNSSGNNGSKGNNNSANNASNDGDNNGSNSSSSNNKNLLKFKDLVSTLANKGHPVNINDISSSFNGTSVNRNSSNNSDNINTSNNAILALSAARKAATGDAATGKRSTAAQTMPTTASASTNTSKVSDFKCSSSSTSSSGGDTTDNETVKNVWKNVGSNNDDDDDYDGGVGNDHDVENDYGMNDDGSNTTTTTTNRPRRADAETSSDDCDDVTSPTATLSVKNLDESITDEKLESLFSVYGQVVSAKVISNEFGASKGFGFVIMAEAQDAVRAIKNLDGRIVVNRPVYVAPTGQPRTLTRA